MVKKWSYTLYNIKNQNEMSNFAVDFENNNNKNIQSNTLL